MSRSALTSFPVQVKQGLVWVYPYMGPEAEMASKRTGPCVTPECEGVEWVMTTAPVGFQAGQKPLERLFRGHLSHSA